MNQQEEYDKLIEKGVIKKSESFEQYGQDHGWTYKRDAKSFPEDYIKKKLPFYEPYKGKYKEGIRLNLGCGHYQFKGFTNIDNINLGQELIWDAEELPLPFEDNSVSFVFISHYAEHHSDIFGLFSELNRICMDGAIIEILAPYWTSENANCELDHKSKFGVHTLDNTYEYGVSRHFGMDLSWKMIKRRIYYSKTGRGVTIPIYKAINFVINKLLVRRHLNLYEKYFAHILVSDIMFYRVKVKK